MRPARRRASGHTAARPFAMRVASSPASLAAPLGRSRRVVRARHVTHAKPAPLDPLRSRGPGYDVMCSELTLELVSNSVASAAGRDAAWASARFAELCAMLSCTTGDLVRLGRADTLAALCLAPDGDVARALVDLRLAFPREVDAGRLAAACPELLMLPGAAAAGGAAYAELAAALAALPSACKALPEAVLQEPYALLTPRAADAARRLLAAGADDGDAVMMELGVRS